MVPLAVTQIPEGVLARWLFTHFVSGMSMVNGLHIRPRSLARFAQPTAELWPEVGFPGDLDALIFTPEFEDEAVAIEFKRIKVKPKAWTTRLPNRMNELEHGVSQANALRKIGFHRSFLAVIIAVDGSERQDVNVFGRVISGKLLADIHGFEAQAKLDDSVGLAFIEVTQLGPESFSFNGTVSVYVKRPAKGVDQPAFVTERLRRLFAGTES